MVVKADDNRLFERFMARFPTKFSNSRANFGTDVFLRDVSAEGAKIASTRRLSLDDSVDLMVDLPDGHDPMHLKGHIVWATNGNGNNWSAGLKFDKVDFMATQRIFRLCH